MKIILSLFILLNFHGLYSQTSQSSGYLLGNYSGRSEPYSMGVIAGKDIIVPGIKHSFIFSANNVVSLLQVSDKGDQVNYKGKWSTSKGSDGKQVYICKMFEVTSSAYPSKPDYYIYVSSDGKISCQENPGSKVRTPAFELKKS